MAGQTAQKLFDVFFAIPARLGTICATPTLAVLFRDSVSRVLSQFPSPFPSPSFARHHLQYFPSPPPCKLPLFLVTTTRHGLRKYSVSVPPATDIPCPLVSRTFLAFWNNFVGSWIVHIFLLFFMRDRIGNLYIYIYTDVKMQLRAYYVF